MKSFYVLAYLLVSLIGVGNAKAGNPYISLDSCDFLIPEGYFVNSGSVREDGITLRATRGGDQSGGVRIRYGVSNAVGDEVSGGFQLRVVQENHAEHFRYFVISVQSPGGKDQPDLVKVQTDAYTLVISGQAVANWKEHLICPALPFPKLKLD